MDLICNWQVTVELMNNEYEKNWYIIQMYKTCDLLHYQLHGLQHILRPIYCGK